MLVSQFVDDVFEVAFRERIRLFCAKPLYQDIVYVFVAGVKLDQDHDQPIDLHKWPHIDPNRS